MANVVLHGISVKVDLAPGGTPEGSPVEVGFLTNFPEILSKTRNITKYNPINSDVPKVVPSGIKNYDPITMEVLYQPGATEGVNKLDEAMDEAIPVKMTIELPDKPSGGSHGTQYDFLAYVSNFKIFGDEDGYIKASVTIEIAGDVTVTAAA